MIDKDLLFLISEKLEKKALFHKLPPITKSTTGQTSVVRKFFNRNRNLPTGNMKKYPEQAYTKNQSSLNLPKNPRT